MKRFILVFLLLINSILLATDDYQQVVMHRGRFGEKTPGLMPIIFRAYPVAVDSTHFQVYLLADITYDFLQFTTQDSSYLAKMEIEASLRNSKTDQVFSKTWRSLLKVDSYRETNLRNKFFLTSDSLTVPPGHYEIKIIYHDLQGEQRFPFSLKLRFDKIKNQYFSPPLFCAIDTLQYSYPSLFPHRPVALRQHLLFNKKFGVYLNVLTGKESQIGLKLKIIRPNSPEPIFSKDTLLNIKSHHANAFFPLPTLEWETGEYLLSTAYQIGEDTVQQKMTFQIIWFDKPRSLAQYEYAVKPLELVMPKDAFKAITSGNKNEKIKKFKDYWKEKDPTPGTAFNEVLLEFYNRVDSADVRFSNKRSHQYGWRSDPGRIYVLYGKPNEIEDASLSPGDPHMIWRYNFKERKMIFKFAAVDGRKRYRLIEEQEVPIP